MAFKKVFYHRYVHDPLEAFIDLMYAANLSSIILSDVHCGYYIGGDGAPHAHMDTDMHHIKENLKAETKARTKPRGISPLTPNVQSFILFITPRIRQLYEGQFTRLLGGVQHHGMAADEKGAINAYGNLNKLFRKFIKTSDPESDYAHTVRKRAFIQTCSGFPVSFSLAKPLPTVAVVASACRVSRYLLYCAHTVSTNDVRHAVASDVQPGDRGAREALSVLYVQLAHVPVALILHPQLD